MALSVKEAKSKLDGVLEHLDDELKKLRTGRANASMLENVKATVYGQPTPLNHIGTITVLDAQMLQIAPFDPNNLDAISAGIRDDVALGLNPSDDGKVVRVPIPAMTKERRLEVVKQLHAKLEEANIAMRNIRHDALNTLKTQVKDKEISEDEERRIEKELNDILSDFKVQSEEVVKAKEAEIMTV